MLRKWRNYLYNIYIVKVIIFMLEYLMFIFGSLLISLEIRLPPLVYEPGHNKRYIQDGNHPVCPSTAQMCSMIRVFYGRIEKRNLI